MCEADWIDTFGSARDGLDEMDAGEVRIHGQSFRHQSAAFDSSTHAKFLLSFHEQNQWHAVFSVILVPAMSL